MTTELKPFRVISRNIYVSDVIVHAKDEEEAEKKVRYELDDEEMRWFCNEFEISDVFEEDCFDEEEVVA